MLELSRTKLESTIKSSGGRFFSTTFTKKDGTERKLTGRLGVTSHLQGGKNNVVKESNSYMTVFDKDVRAYRTVNLDTVTELHIDKKAYRIK